FLVLGNLLIRGIHASKAYARFPGWDVLATNPETGQARRVQVKARLATDFDGGFPIKNFDAEFVVLVALYRGYRYARLRRSLRDGTDTGERDPQFFVLPMPVVVEACRECIELGCLHKGLHASRHSELAAIRERLAPDRRTHPAQKRFLPGERPRKLTDGRI